MHTVVIIQTGSKYLFGSRSLITQTRLIVNVNIDNF